MITIAINLARNIGDEDLILFLFDGQDPLDENGFNLVEVEDSFGRFEADAPIVPYTTYRAVVVKDDNVIYDGWLTGATVDDPTIVGLTEERISLLDKLNVTGIIAHSDDADRYKAEIPQPEPNPNIGGF